MNRTDTLRRDMKPATHLESFSPETQKALARAATRGAANLTEAQAAEIGERVNLPGWLMVPTKRGERQIAVSTGRAFRL
jgi:hypothetical protein